MKHVYFVDTKLLCYYLFQRGSSIYEMYNFLAKFLIQLPKGEVYLAWDIGKSSYRTAISPTYKGHRDKNKSKLTPQEQKAYDDFNKAYIKLSSFSEIFNVTCLAVQGVEADDLISIKCKEYDDKGYCVTLLTNDFDYSHMVIDGKNTRMLGVYDGVMYTKDMIKSKYGLQTRRQFSILKSIQGDESDNIKFCLNLGPAKAQEIYSTLYKKYTEPTDDNCIEVIEDYLLKKELNRIKRNLKTSITIHQDHQDVGRTDVRSAFLANISIADPFTDTSLMTPAQVELFNSCTNKYTPISDTELFNKSLDELGIPLLLSNNAKKILGVIDV